MSQPFSRRVLIRSAVLLGTSLAATLRATQASAAGSDPEIPLLAEDSVTGQSLGYVAKASKVDVKKYPTYKPGQLCRNCSLYDGEADASAGGCELVLGQFVRADGWCKSWAARQGS
ncbi:MAG: high-potential iron-sulfur protein [Steroidobacteraceae bacterium]